MLVTTKNVGFAKAVRAKRVLAGVARNQVIGTAEPRQRKQTRVEREGRGPQGPASAESQSDERPRTTSPEPLSPTGSGTCA